MIKGVKQLAENHYYWKKDYNMDSISGNITHIDTSSKLELENDVKHCFTDSFA